MQAECPVYWANGVLISQIPNLPQTKGSGANIVSFPDPQYSTHTLEGLAEGPEALECMIYK